MVNSLEKKSAKQLWLSISSTLFGSFGSSIFSFGLSFFLLEQTGSAYSFALSAMIGPIVSLVLLPISGPFADKFDRKKIIIFSQLFSIIALLLFVLFFNKLENNIFFWSVIIITALKITDSFTSTAQMSARSNLVLEKDLKKLSGYTESANSIVAIASSILGAILYSLLSFTWLIIFEIITEMITLFITLFLNFELVAHDHTQNDSSDSFLQLFIKGIQYVKSQKYLSGIILLALSINFFAAILSVGLPLLSMNVLNVTTTQFGLIQASSGLGMVFGGWIIGQKNKKNTEDSLLSKTYMYITWIAIFNILIGLVPIISSANTMFNSILVSLPLFLLSLTIVLINVPLNVWIQMNVSKQMQGRVFSILSAIGMAVTPIGTAIYGMIFDINSMPLSVVSSSAFVITGILLFITASLTLKVLHVDLAKAEIF